MSSIPHIPDTPVPSDTFLREMHLRVEAEAAEHEDHLTRERHAEYQIRQFQQGVTGAGVTLSRKAGLRGANHPISGFLGERRDTQGLLTGEARAMRKIRVIFSRRRLPGAKSLERWENEGGAIN